MVQDTFEKIKEEDIEKNREILTKLFREQCHGNIYEFIDITSKFFAYHKSVKKVHKRIILELLLKKK